MGMLLTLAAAALLLEGDEGEIERCMATLPDEGEVVEESIRFAPNGDHVGFVLKKGGQSYAVIDGETSEAGYEEVENITFSPDGATVTYTAAIGGKRGEYDILTGAKWHLVVNGEKGPEFDSVLGVFYAGESCRLVYGASRMKGETEEFFVLVDGTENGPYRSMPWFETSPATDRVAIAGAKDLGWFLDIEGEKGPEFDRIENVDFSPDGGHVTYIASRGRKQVLLVDGKEIAEAQEIRFPGAVFSPDGEAYAYVIKEGEQEHLVSAGKKGPKHAMILQLAVGADGIPAYVIPKPGDKYAVVRGDKEGVAFGAKIGAELWWKAAHVE